MIISYAYDLFILFCAVKGTDIFSDKENEKYYFKYILENVKEAQKDGFELLVAFPQINAT